MVNYTFVGGDGEHYEEFEQMCQQRLAEGWTAQGGISATYDPNGEIHYFQAFVR